MKFFVLFIFMACTMKQKDEDRFSVMNRLWHENASRDQLIEKLGSDFEKKHDGIIYWFPWKSIESGHFFDSSGKLSVQFLFVPKERFQDLKKSIACQWNEKSEFKGIGHTVHKIDSGKCDSENISYEYRPSMLLYEFRWEKQKNQ